jgi:predicted Mrr-cat superfamily restriction endonuclease
MRRTLSIGRLHGAYVWRDEAPDQHCRKVRWLQTDVPRDQFSSAAQKAASGRAAFFSVGRGVEEFETCATTDGIG